MTRDTETQHVPPRLSRRLFIAGSTFYLLYGTQNRTPVVAAPNEQSSDSISKTEGTPLGKRIFNQSTLTPRGDYGLFLDPSVATELVNMPQDLGDPKQPSALLTDEVYLEEQQIYVRMQAAFFQPTETFALHFIHGQTPDYLRSRVLYPRLKPEQFLQVAIVSAYWDHPRLRDCALYNVQAERLRFPASVILS